MFIELLTVEFYLSGCNSLKQKRRALSGLKDKFGKASCVAVVESGYQDVHKRSEWSFVVCGTEKTVVEKKVFQIEQYLQTEIDAEVCHIKREKF